MQKKVVLKEHERPSRPVLFFTEGSDFPYWGKGSSFFITNGSCRFWVTAQHVIDNQGASVQDLMITPSDETAIPIPFNEQIEINQGSEYEDYRDICIIRVDFDKFWETKESDLYAWNIDRDFYDCSRLSNGEELYLLGFPSESRYVDYDVKTIHFTSNVLRGIYQGPATENNCYTLQLETSIELDDLDGLSGSVVFRYPYTLDEPVQAVGMLIRGSASSAILEFIDCAVIRDFVR